MASANETLGRECDVVAASAQQGFVYLLLCGNLIKLILLRRRQEEKYNESEEPKAGLIYGGLKRHNLYGTNLRLHVPIWVYVIIAFFDLEANYLTIIAFRYTSITSVSLLDAVTIPSAMICSRFMLSRKYNFRHVVGASVCLAGLVTITFADLEYGETISEDNTDDNDFENPHSFSGDILAIAGAILFGVNNTITEFFVRKVDSDEYLGMLGFCGVFLAIIQSAIIERHDVYKFFAPDHDCHHEHAVFLWISYVVAAWLLYTGIARFLQVSEAALMNLNFLTADLYAVLFSVFAEGVIPSEFYFVALVCIVCGVYLYETAPSPVGPLDSDQIEAEDRQYQNEEEARNRKKCNSPTVSSVNSGVEMNIPPPIETKEVTLEIT
eukprot:CAMPEP_0116061718 /NCGR_PEP_ID=MMETSP0322-20121206/7256_1 /TAXON_ID=163516 /ORGANISM="Leptocylindrus danicus var. apora, Strain B651" /LENGTH=380 /DNA_ID=CAMNT_0003546739 /DNA_START=460 /DNA_END=1602 /DNA_ORIENTATION=+